MDDGIGVGQGDGAVGVGVEVVALGIRVDATNEVIGYRPADPSLSSGTIGVVDTITLAQRDEDGVLIGRPDSGCGRGCQS